MNWGWLCQLNKGGKWSEGSYSFSVGSVCGAVCSVGAPVGGSVGFRRTVRTVGISVGTSIGSVPIQNRPVAVEDLVVLGVITRQLHIERVRGQIGRPQGHRVGQLE